MFVGVPPPGESPVTLTLTVMLSAALKLPELEETLVIAVVVLSMPTVTGVPTEVDDDM
jgi:hypothetical protein